MGSFGGSLKDFTATQLGSFAIKGAIAKAGIDAALVQDVIMGCVIQANLGQAPARQAAKFAGLPDSVNCTTVNKVCASGMKAIAQAAQSILLGDADVVVAGGMESMSNVPFYSPNMRWGNKYGNVNMIDGLAKDGLTDVYHNYAMGNAADMCAKERNITRDEQDAFAIESYKRSQAAITDGYVDAEQAPEWFTTTPSLALPKAVAKAGLQMSDLNFVELNEAFSVVGLVNMQKMNLDASKVNVNGGAVSLGHPLGCSGARIIVTLINVLKQNNGKIGGAGICNGGGGASAMVIENV
ncbi:unnamed protein product [Rotaria sp. Silwood1]|nr:unnamed protein product [Rotaria sp. Silwood1]CAF5025238.1 unnamed protein product [Rotaria sp. Silwood1]